MNSRTFISVAGAIFGVVAAMHAVRLLRGWEILIGGWSVPVWVSVLGLLVAGYLAYAAFHLRRSIGN